MSESLLPGKLLHSLFVVFCAFWQYVINQVNVTETSNTDAKSMAWIRFAVNKQLCCKLVIHAKRSLLSRDHFFESAAEMTWKKAILSLSVKWRLVKMCQQPVIYHPQIIFCCVFLTGVHLSLANTPNANMADHSVGVRDESHESKVSQALMFRFHNAFPEKSCFIVDLVPLFRPLYLFLCSWMPPQESEIFHSRESVLFFSYLVCL